MAQGPSQPAHYWRIYRPYYLGLFIRTGVLPAATLHIGDTGEPLRLTLVVAPTRLYVEWGIGDHTLDLGWSLWHRGRRQTIQRARDDRKTDKEQPNLSATFGAPLPSGGEITRLLDATPGAYERAQQGLAEAAEGRATSMGAGDDQDEAVDKDQDQNVDSAEEEDVVDFSGGPRGSRLGFRVPRAASLRCLTRTTRRGGARLARATPA
jgi:hypothetical protein